MEWCSWFLLRDKGKRVATKDEVLILLSEFGKKIISTTGTDRGDKWVDFPSFRHAGIAPL